MQNSEIKETKPKYLIKSRMQHKRIFSVFLIALLVVSTTRWPENQFVHEIMQWSGYILILLGVGIRIYSSLYAGGFKNEKVLNIGPYSIVRNPLYVGTFIIIVGIGLQTASLFLTTLLISVFFFYYKFIIEGEERYLENKFGTDFVKYKKEVPRWLPKMSLWQSPESIMIYPRYALITARDLLLFLLIIPLFELLHILQSQGIVKTFFSFY